MDVASSPIPCRLCGGREARVCFQKDGYSILKCSQCDLVYLDHAPQPDELLALYSAEYFHDASNHQGYHDYYTLQSSITATAQMRLKQIARFRSPGRLLEIGCAMGFFLQAAQRAGWQAQGVELSDYAASVAQEQFGLPVMRGRLEDAQFPAASFDVVVLWDVVEHVPAPVSLMCETARVLKPDGLIALSTGDVASLVARVSGSRWHLYNVPQHLSFFSPKTLVHLLESVGLRRCRLRHDGAMYTLDYLAHRLKTIYPNQVISRLCQAFRKIPLSHKSVWVNLGDIMTAFAGKD